MMHYCDYCKHRGTAWCEDCVRVEDVYDSDNNAFYEDIDYTNFEDDDEERYLCGICIL